MYYAGIDYHKRYSVIRGVGCAPHTDSTECSEAEPSGWLLAWNAPSCRSRNQIHHPHPPVADEAATRHHPPLHVSRTFPFPFPRIPP